MTGIGVLTTTFYKSMEETRFHLACQMIGNAVAVGHHVVVVDGSPEPIIRHSLTRIGATVVAQTAQGMGASRRELFWCPDRPDIFSSISATWRAPLLPGAFLWLEPEKVDLIRWIPQIIAPIERGEADIVIPARTPNGYASCPAFQSESEQHANAVYAEVTGKPFDVMFGPVAFRRAMLLPYFAACNPAERFGTVDTYIQHIAPMEAMAAGYRVTSVPVGFLYPPAQKAEEESALSEAMREKRRRQLEECTHAFRVVAEGLKLKS